MEIKQVSEKLANQNLDQLAKSLGYKTTESFQKTLDKFNQSETLKDWLWDGGYDLVNTSTEFVTKLANALNIDITQSMNVAVKYNSLKKKLKDSYIYAITDYKRDTETVFQMMHDNNKRKIPLYADDLLFKTKQEVIDTISKKVVHHYEKKHETVKGNILYYEVYLLSEKYICHIDGSFKEPIGWFN
ncbi:hypothetical protein [Francisella tularensis]|uniref:hypothetical protein n=1 Tax=Francisella tularensis TaxID=263 RepID=UPI0008F464C3|nr:hypothetical protein [Francisella tularensis]APA83527.1 hypothetical protein N894_1543 [Francisella tularensis subsp. novicida PA10-7858]